MRAGLMRVDAGTLPVDVVEHLACELNIVVCKLADLCIVDSEDLSLLRRAEGKPWDHVHDEKNKAGTDKGVGAASEGVG